MIFANLTRQPAIKAYWWNKQPNFGDALTPLLLERFADIENVQRDTISRSLIASVGSILEHIPPEWDGYIVGSGKLIENSRLNSFGTTATILAFRGPLTAKGFKGDFALGDPGILANELVGPQEKQWDLGIVPHWQDDQLAARFTALVPAKSTVRVISPMQDPLTILREIGACRRIVTSSLHGMIVADAFGGIPRRIEACDKMLTDGGIFKFRDYSQSIKSTLELGKMMEPARVQVEEIKFAIYDAYRELGSEVKKHHVSNPT
jgi:pyruvyltransferase